MSGNQSPASLLVDHYLAGEDRNLEKETTLAIGTKLVSGIVLLNQSREALQNDVFQLSNAVLSIK